MSMLRAPEGGPTRVRVYLGGELVADTKHHVVDDETSGAAAHQVLVESPRAGRSEGDP